MSRRRWGWCIEWKLVDLWIGVFWKHSHHYKRWPGRRTDWWICLVPCVPIHIWRIEPGIAKGMAEDPRRPGFGPPQ